VSAGAQDVELIRKGLWANNGRDRDRGEKALDLLLERQQRQDEEIERLKTPAWDRLAAKEVKRLEARVQQLEALISEHHAVGVMDNALVGDKCPVCASAALDDPAYWPGQADYKGPYPKAPDQ